MHYLSLLIQQLNSIQFNLIYFYIKWCNIVFEVLSNIIYSSLNYILNIISYNYICHYIINSHDTIFLLVTQKGTQNLGSFLTIHKCSLAPAPLWHQTSPIYFLPKINRPNVVRIVERRVGFCWY